MKVVCESCQAKYTVADEKVQGKTAKIKCKRCGATIVVSSAGVVSTTGGSAEASASAAAPAGLSYMVNVAEGDQRTLSVAEIVDAYNAGTIDGETFVWADGLPDWQPLSAVAEIVAALQEGAAAAHAADPEPSGLEAPSRAAVRRDPARSADLFGARAEPTPAPAPAAEPAFFGSGASKPAGQRDENSMLFSLSALTAKAPSSFVGQTTATKEDSGLIDLRALGANSSSSQSDLLVDSVALLPLGAPPPPPQAQMLVAPPVGTSIAPPPAKSKTPLFIGLGAVVALVAVAGAYFATRPDPTPPAPVAAATTTAEVAPTAAPTAEPTAEPSAAAASASAAPSAAPVAANRPSGGGKPAGGGKPTGGTSGDPGAKPTSTAPPKPTAPARGNCGCAPSDLMCAMRCSAGK